MAENSRSSRAAERTLAAAMRDGSRAEHEAAEGSRFMAELLAGRLGRRGYIAYLDILREVYAALEHVVREHRADPIVAAAHDPVLERSAAIEADLAVWAAGPALTTDSAAGAAYVSRIFDATRWGGLIVAHHYTRYLGDLSGGQAIGRCLDREFEMGGAGLAFYSFDIAKPKRYKDDYKQRLDALDLADEQIEAVVDEVKVAFGLNQQVFAELSDRIEEFGGA